MDIQAQLLAMADENYREFTAKLVPTIDVAKIIGIRIPVLRQYAKKIAKEYPQEASGFMQTLAHHYLEENHLHAMLVERIQDYDTCMAETERFLPQIDNWCTCDIFHPKIFKKYPSQVRSKINDWLKSDHEYTIRYAIGILLSNYLKENFDKADLKQVAEIQSEEYYVQMMMAWYFSMALVHQYEDTIPYLEKERFSRFVHQKTIQKAIESRQISEDTKQYLKSLRKKG